MAKTMHKYHNADKLKQNITPLIVDIITPTITIKPTNAVLIVKSLITHTNIVKSLIMPTKIVNLKMLLR